MAEAGRLAWCPNAHDRPPVLIVELDHEHERPKFLIHAEALTNAAATGATIALP